MWKNAASLSTQSERRFVSVRSNATNAGITSPIHRKPKNYDIIVENNLFRPLGWERAAAPPVEQSPTPNSEPVVAPPFPLPTYGLTLTGIVKRGPNFLAVVEDQEMSAGMFLRRGEMLKDTAVQEIAPNHITLTRGEMAVKLTLGERIEYGTDGRVMFGSIAKPQELEAPVEEGDNGQDIIERMRERRRNELNQ